MDSVIRSGDDSSEPWNIDRFPNFFFLIDFSEVIAIAKIRSMWRSDKNRVGGSSI